MTQEERIEQAVYQLLEAVGENPDREGLLDTPKRVAKMYAEMFSGLDKDPKDEFTAVFSEGHKEVVLVKDIPFHSMCEHHLVPFYGVAHVAYLPSNGRVTGLSKLVGNLFQTKLVSVSSFYETPAWGMTEQDDFLNVAACLETELGTLELLDECQRIEKELDRVRHEHWWPRTIDIDILLYGEDRMDLERLKVPHPYMDQRAFVLVPLLEIDPTLSVPKESKTYQKYLSQLDQSEIKKIS